MFGANFVEKQINKICRFELIERVYHKTVTCDRSLCIDPLEK
jgi:hypothetical protein